MIKSSKSSYKIPFYDLSKNALISLDKIKTEYFNVICICPENGSCDNNNQGGYNYSFSYSIEPTIEPVIHKVRGYKQNSNLTYSNIGVDYHNEILQEIFTYLSNIKTTYAPIGESLEINFASHEQLNFDNQNLSQKIFQKNKRYEYKEEIYDYTTYLDKFITNISIQSNVYIVNIKFEVVDQNDL